MKEYAKIIIVSMFIVITLPFSLLSIISFKLFKSEEVFTFFGQLFSLIPGVFGRYVRSSFYVIVLKKCSYDISIGFCSYFSRISASVGKRVVIASYSIIGMASIKDNVLVSSRVSILSGKNQHGEGLQKKDKSTTNGLKYKGVNIGERSWIGESSVIM